ncbi:ATP-binding protein [Sphingomonas morindae]|uniref:Helix-turn-helix transcriptional regulator n=1 Tax=Sphingomonas morindae TaxID=1541170 RepID=A0ABY4XAW6_9SPHN|nr:winged helix-turn-helix domain-containing protein [Sphingomonas morindae]USI73881.1 helix-turn-helix transcriptional regulator [Sphingomonas morindae]
MRERLTADVAFRFGAFQLVPSRHVLLRDGKPVKLGGRALDILHLLVRRAGEEVTKRELNEFAWPNVFVDEHNLKVHISNLRRVLEDTLPQARYIATVVGRGYRFVARVHLENADGATFAAPEEEVGCSLPLLPTLIGRQQDVENIGRSLDQVPLLTLVGAGGVGKTSLAIAVAHLKHGAFADGVRFVDLSATDDPSLVPHIISACLGLKGDPTDPVGAIVEHLQFRRLLIVLDNCEHVLPMAATIVARLVGAGVRSRVLATSREPIGVVGEDVQRVEPLRFPTVKGGLTAAEASTFSSVQLFTVLAKEAVDFRLDDANALAVVSLCEALDGLPLAIEIAAAQISNFSPADLLESVVNRLDEGGDGRKVSQARHRTLSATVEWSYRLLSIDEATIFRLLSVFASHFGMADVAYMAGLVHLGSFQITFALGSLVSKSLISAEIREDQVCYRLLESTKCYAADALLREPIAPEAFRQHARLVLTSFEQSTVEWGRLQSSVWLSRYEGRVGDLRKALDWCFGDDGDPSLGIDIAVAAIRFWNERSSISEQLFQVGRALEYSDGAPSEGLRQAVLAQSLAYSMTLARRPQHEADQAWSRALRLSKLSENIERYLSAMYGKALFLIYSGRNEDALAVLDEYLNLARERGDWASQHDGERLGTLAGMHLGRISEVQQTLERLAQDLLRGVPTSSIVRYQEQRYVSIHTTLAFTRWLTGEPERAHKMTDEMILKLEDVGQLMGQSNILALVALPLAVWSGDEERLERHLSLLRRNLDRENIRLWEPVYRFYAGVARHHAGDAQSLTEMTLAVQELLDDGMLVRTPMYKGILADSLLAVDRAADALKEIDAALFLQWQTDEAWCLPELLRIKSRVLRSLGEEARASEVMNAAVDNARAIGAHELEARILLDRTEGLATGRGHERPSVPPHSAQGGLEEKPPRPAPIE